MTLPKPRSTTLLLALSMLVAPRAAHADPKKDCAAAYDKTQVLRDQGKLTEAYEQALACSSSKCPAVARQDCLQWVNDLDARLPTVIFSADDASGASTVAVRVSIDGQLRVAKLDGRPLALDPGEHVLHFEMAGAAPVEQKIVLQEREQNRTIHASFRVAPKAPELATPPSPPPPKEGPALGVPAVISLSVGGAGLLVGAIAGGVTVARAVDIKSQCRGSVCPASLKPKADSAQAIAGVSDAGFLIGGIGLVTGAVLLIVRAKSAPPPSTSFVIGPGTVALRGTLP